MIMKLGITLEDLQELILRRLVLMKKNEQQQSRRK
jgi:hypothetical protein